MSQRSKVVALFVVALSGLVALVFAVSRADGRSVRAGDGGGELVDRGRRLPDVDPVAANAHASAKVAGDGRERTSVEIAAVPEPTASGGRATGWEEGFDGFAVYGTVLDDAARPIEGARCLLFERDDDRGDDEPRTPRAECLTNADGRYRFVGQEEFTSYELYADAEGFLPGYTTRRTGVDEDLTLQPSAGFAGRVLEAGTKAPLVGVRVAISNRFVGEDGELATSIESFTDADGRYRVPFARLDKMQRVMVARPGGVPITREFQVRADRPEGYDIELGSGPELTLRIYRLEDGRPVADQEVDVGNDLSVTTDARGMARVELPDVAGLNDGRVYFTTRLDGMCRTTRTLSLLDGAPTEPVDLPLFGGARVTGVVRIKDGGPAADATVYVSNRNRGLEGYDLPSGVSIRSGDSRTRTGGDGRFEISGMLPGDGEIRAYASHDDHPRAVSDPFYLATASAVKELTLELGAGALVEGVVTLNGEPTRARVYWRSEDGNGDGASNDSGAYRIRGVAAGRVTIGAALEDGGWNDDDHKEEISVELGKVNRHDIAIAKNRAAIAGRVRDASGSPVAGARVSGWAEDDGRNDWHYASDATDAEGGFELTVDDTPGVVWQVWASEGQRNASVSNVVVGTTNVELVLPRTGKLRLEVVDEVTRDAVNRFNVYWRQRDAGEPFRSLSQGGREMSPGPDGVFEAELPVGTLDLRIAAREQGYVPVELPNVVVVEGVVGPTSLVPLTKGVTVEIAFRALGANDKRPRVTLVTDAQRDELKLSQWNDYNGREIQNAQRAQPNGEGKAVLKAMAPGRYSLWNPPRNFVFEPDTFEIPPVDVHVIEIGWRFDESPEGNDQDEDALHDLGY